MKSDLNRKAEKRVKDDWILRMKGVESLVGRVFVVEEAVGALTGALAT